MRKLASIQTIDDLSPIEGKDRILLAKVLGWSVIVTKDFNVGDKVVYIEIDSVLPEKPEFEFLRPKKFRIKTMKLGNAVSQGIVFPLTILPKGEYEIGQDVTDLIGVKQYEPLIDDPVPQTKTQSTGKIKKRLMKYRLFRRLYKRFGRKQSTEFPSDLVSKTDEVRIQTVPELLKDTHHRYVLTEKVDGTSGTFILKRRRGLLFNHDEFIVCSRNHRRPKPDDSIYWQVVKKYEIEKVLKLLADFYGARLVCLQGECIGPKVQANRYKLKEPRLCVFNLIVDGVRFPSIEAKSALLNLQGLETPPEFVPIVDVDVLLPEIAPDVPTMLYRAAGKSQIADVSREGLVVRSTDGSVSFKAVDPLYLLEYDE